MPTDGKKFLIVLVPIELFPSLLPTPPPTPPSSPLPPPPPPPPARPQLRRREGKKGDELVRYFNSLEK